MIEIMNKLWRAQKQLTQELGREPTPEAVEVVQINGRYINTYIIFPSSYLCVRIS